jgi:hypothetical protein
MTRRQLLLSGIGGVLGGARRLIVRLLIAGSWSVPVAARAATAPPGDIVETLVALAEVLVGEHPLSPDTRRDVIDDLRDAASTSPVREARYTATARLLDRLAGDGFARLPFADRRALVAEHRLGSSRLGADEAETLPEDLRDARIRVAPELIAAYWRAPAGWSNVGYTTFPGRCGDLTQYTRRPT